jgi:hypothetical protein
MSAYSGVWQLDLIQLPPAAMLSFSAPSRIFVGVTNDIPATVDAGQDRLTMTREGEVLVVKVTRDLTQEIINAKFHLESFDDLIQQLF